MFKFLPDKYSIKWFIYLISYTVILSTIFYIGRVFILHQSLSAKNIVVFLLVSFVVSIVTCFTGFLNCKVIFIFSSLGLLIGSVAMIYNYTSHSGWEDLVGPLMFIEMFVLGIVAGIAGELIWFVIRSIRK